MSTVSKYQYAPKNTTPVYSRAGPDGGLKHLIRCGGIRTKVPSERAYQVAFVLISKAGCVIKPSNCQ